MAHLLGCAQSQLINKRCVTRENQCVEQRYELQSRSGSQSLSFSSFWLNEECVDVENQVNDTHLCS